MRKKSFDLTKGEESMMEIFWDADSPLTIMEVSRLTDEFNDSYIHRLVKSLEKKEMLKVVGLQKSGKQYARQFFPAMTREEYGAGEEEFGADVGNGIVFDLLIGGQIPVYIRK